VHAGKRDNRTVVEDGALGAISTQPQAVVEDMYFSMGMTTLIALVGNIQTSLPAHEQNIFTWLEAVMSLLLVLSTTYVLKDQLLETI